MPQATLGRRILTALSRSRTFLWVVVLLGLYLSIPSKSFLPLGATGMAANCLAPQDLQQQGGTAGRALIKVGSADASAPSVTVTDHRTTATEPPGNCDTPTAKSSFSPTDARAYQWTLVSGAVNGDVVRWDFRRPDGQSHFLTDPFTVTFNGGACLWAYINIAGTTAASLLGTWEVRVLYNNTVVATDTFTIRTDTVVLTEHRTTGTAPTTCTPPPSKTIFAPTDPSVYQFTRVTGALIGDQVKWEFVQPNGSIYATSNVLTLTGDGDRCFWVSIDIAGQPAASLLGTWQVRVLYNNVALLPTPDTFTIAQATCPTVNGINPSIGVPGSSVTITGTNFTGVTAVKFGGGTNASFTVVNATTITAVVPSGAVTSPLTLTKPSCNDVLTPSFTVITDPVIEVTPSSLNFGSVVVGSAVTRQVMVRNLGGKALLFNSISSSQPQFVIQAATSGFGLAIGGSVTINVNFTPDSAGVKTANLLLASNDPTQPVVSVQMTGTGLAPTIEVSPTPLAFGDLRLTQTKDLVLSLRNNGTSPLNVTDVDSNSPLFAVIQFTEKPSNAVRSLPLNIAPGGLVEATIRFRPPFLATSIGNQNGLLLISSNDPGRPRVDVPMTGRGLGPAISAPTSLALGSVAICSGAPVTAGLTLVNTGNDPLTIVGLATTNPAFSIIQRPTLPIVVAPNGSLQLTIGFSTRTIGTQNANLLVSSNAAANGSLSIALSAAGAALAAPSIGPIVASRTTLSHGRVDSARPATVFNPSGLVDVIGFVFQGGPLPINSIAPGLIPAALIGGFPGLPPAAIPSAPDPFRITLSGGVANPVVAAAANIPSSFTLFVAEGIVAPALTKWERVGSRFGSGNLYATVAIPGTAIVPGMELVSEADLNAYTANSIIFEAPDFGFVVAPAGQNGGTASIQARARTIPGDTQCAPVTSQVQSADVEFSRTVRIEILPAQTVITRVPGGVDVSVTAQISGNFDPAVNTVVRWGFDGNSVDIVVDMPDMTPPGAPRLLTQVFHLPIDEECKLAKVTAVASSLGNVPLFFLPPINPFLVLAPSSIDLFTFRSGGTTVEDTQSVLVKLPDSNCAGGGPASWIHGVVSDAITGAPIAGADVTVVGVNITSITGSDGEYALNNLQPGTVTLSVSADGFNPKQVQVNVASGQVVKQDISLLPMTGGISGLVIDTVTILPVSGASVSVKGSNIAAVTGSDGRYVLSGVPIGPQTVTASKFGFTSDEGIVNVIGDLTVGRDFFITPTLGRITGIVRNATTNLPIAGATVSAAGISATTDGAGSYTLIDVPAGAQSISATATDYNPGSASATVTGGATATGNISLQPLLGSVSGFIRNADTNDPISGAIVSISGTQLSAASGADGSYVINNVPVGARSVSATASGFVTAQRSVTVLGNATVPQDISLSPTKGSIQGKITDSVTFQPINGVEVELLPFPLSFGTTNASGDYTLSDVNTGTQVILATKTGYYSKIVVVNVTANQASTADFAMVPNTGSVTGVVRDEFSQAVSGAFVTAPGTGAGTTTGADGTFTLTSVPAGTRTLEASAGNNYTTVQVSREIKAGETINQSFVLASRGGAISGRVTDAATGQGIDGATVTTLVPGPLFVSGGLTSGGGFYTLSRLPEGGHAVSVSANGYEGATGIANVTVDGTATLNFALTREVTTGSISGFVKDSLTGNGITGATITVSDHPFSTSTFSDGFYQVLNVAAGSHVVTASKQGYQNAQLQVTVTKGLPVMANLSLTPNAQTLGTVTGTIRNAANADPIAGASITLTGTNFATTSGAGGTYTLTGVPQDSYTLVASANGFLNSQVPISITGGQTLTQNLSLSPTLPAGEIRITLNWTKDGAAHPRDLDAHLVGPNPNGSCFHVYYGGKGDLTAAPFAQLEVDNISITGAPPIETIRIAKLSPGIYRFYVYNFDNEDADGIARSRATVQVFGASGSLGSFTVGSGSGRNWTVFEINGQNGVVRAINQLVTPSGSCTAPQ